MAGNVDPFQVRVARIALSVAKEHGFALGGGDFLAAMRRLDGVPDAAFVPYGLDPAAVKRLREQFAEWPRQ